MSNYSNNPRNVRVDLFKPRGKWYETVEVTWIGDSKGLISEEFETSLFAAVGKDKANAFDAICLEPYHIHSHPIQRKAKNV